MKKSTPSWSLLVVVSFAQIPVAFADPEPVALKSVLPQTESDVPRNTRIFVEGNQMLEPTLTLCDDAAVDLLGCPGTSIPLSERVGPLAISQDLSQFLNVEPGPIGLFVDSFGGQAAVTLYVIDALDETPPFSPELLEVESAWEWVGGTGGQERGVYRPRWEAAQDDYGVAYYRVETSVVGQDDWGFEVAVASTTTASTFRAFETDAAEPRDHRVIAVDIAGNQSEPSNVVAAYPTLGPACGCISSTTTSMGASIFSLFLLGFAFLGMGPRRNRSASTPRGKALHAKPAPNLLGRRGEKCE